MHANSTPSAVNQKDSPLAALDNSSHDSPSASEGEDKAQPSAGSSKNKTEPKAQSTDSFDATVDPSSAATATPSTVVSSTAPNSAESTLPQSPHHSHSSSCSSNTTATNTTFKAVLSPHTPKSSASSRSLQATPIRPTPLPNTGAQPRLLLDLEPSSPFFSSSSKTILGFDSPVQLYQPTSHDPAVVAPSNQDQSPLESKVMEESPVQDTSSGMEAESRKSTSTSDTSSKEISKDTKEPSEARSSPPSTPGIKSSVSILSQSEADVDYFTPSSYASLRSTNSPESLVTKSSIDGELSAEVSGFQISHSGSSSTRDMDPALLAAITNTEAQNMALDFYQGTANTMSPDNYASWMGDEGTFAKDTREAFMALFTFKGKSILGALRDLCEKLYMKGESQQLHRIMESFSSAWNTMNPQNGFLDTTIVYTIAYALLLLNTDLYAADHTANKKISKSKFVSNTMETIKAHVSSLPEKTKKALAGRIYKSPDVRPNHNRMSSFSYSMNMGSSKDDSTILVNDCPISALSREWQFQIESVLKVFYASISKDALELHTSAPAPQRRSMSLSHTPGLPNVSSSSGMASTGSLSSSTFHSSNMNSASTNNLMPSLSLTPSIRPNPGSSSSIFGRLTLNRLRANRTSFDQYNQSRIDFSNDRSGDSYRRDSFNSLFSMDSTASGAFGGNRHAVGFAGLLASSMIKEDEAANEESFGDFSKIEEELAKEVELELLGAPWAKEGLLQYRPYIDPSTGKKSKKKDWTQVFVVVQRGQLKMFRFNTSSSSSASSGGVVGAGNWMESADLVDGFHLCHTMAQELPATKKSRGYNALWSLTLPQHGVLVFQSGTKEIAREYVYTCNYWAGRLSKEPFDEPVSSMEYGWGNALEGISEDNTGNGSSGSVAPPGQPRLTHKGSAPVLGRIPPGDRISIKEWRPSGQSLIVSDLNEEKQAASLREYVLTAERNLSKHNALRARIMQAYTPNGANFTKAHSNWERKSQYLLQQFIRYKIYVDCLERALRDKASKAVSTARASSDLSDTAVAAAATAATATSNTATDTNPKVSAV